MTPRAVSHSAARIAARLWTILIAAHVNDALTLANCCNERNTMEHERFTQEQAQEMYDALSSIRLYANDTLSGRADGPDDREWQRSAVVEIRNHARAAIARVDAQPAETITLLTQEKDTLTCEDYDPDDPLEVTITPLGLIGLAERAGIDIVKELES
jgi:hypothetical protein